MRNIVFLLILTGTLQIASSVFADERVNLLENPGFQGLKNWKLDDASHGFEAVELGGRPLLRYQERGDGARPSHADQVVLLKADTLYHVGVRVLNRGEGLKPALRISDTDWQTLVYVEPEVTAMDSGEEARQQAQLQVISTYFYSQQEQEVRFQLFGAGREYRAVERSGEVFFADPLIAECGDEQMREFLSATLIIDPAKTIEPVNRMFFGVNSLFWITDDEARADGKIEKYLREMQCGLIRFPGGEVADNFHWRTNRLDDNRSFPFQDGDSKLDFDEFIEWNRRIGSQAICVVNLESCFLNGDIDQGVQEAADWVRYSNIEKQYGVKYWEIGNETDLIGTRYPLSAKQYADAVVRFSRAMKAVDPSIQIGALGPTEQKAVCAFDRLTTEAQQQARLMSRNDLKLKKNELAQRDTSEMDSWWPTVIKTAGDDFDFAIVHRYDSTRTTMPTMYAAPYKLREMVERLDGYLKAETGRDIPIALTEWNCWKNSKMNPVDHALSIAEQAGNYLEGGVDMANFWPMRYPHGKGEEQFRVLLDYETKEPRPAYEVMKMLSTRAGDTIVESKLTNDHLYAIATRNNEDGRITIFVINRLGVLASSSERAGNAESVVQLTFDTPGLKLSTATAQSLVSVDQGQRLEERECKVQRDGDDLMVSLPSRSFTVIEIR